MPFRPLPHSHSFLSSLRPVSGPLGIEDIARKRYGAYAGFIAVQLAARVWCALLLLVKVQNTIVQYIKARSGYTAA